MQFSTIAAALFAPIAAVQAASIGLDLFRNGDCTDVLTSITVNGDSCFTGSSTGWSSMKINNRNGLTDVSSLTAYSANNCAGASGEHGYSASNFDCLNNFGFGAANAVGLSV